jgi:hypothetical protein
LQDQSTGEADFSKRQAFTMLKHRCAALLIFHDAETPLRNTGDFLLDAETPLFSIFFIPSHFPKYSSPPFPHHHSRNNFVQHLFCFSPSIAETSLAATFPIAKTPATLHFLPLLKHRLPATFHHFSRC